MTVITPSSFRPGRGLRAAVCVMGPPLVEVNWLEQVNALDTPKPQALVGNTFPLPLIRRPVLIEPLPLPRLRESLAGAEVHSFWGHTNTLQAASTAIGLDLTPAAARPALRLTKELLPELDGVAFSECWVVSPDYRPGFRPGPGDAVALAEITGWQVLRMRWPEEREVSQ